MKNLLSHSARFLRGIDARARSGVRLTVAACLIALCLPATAANWTLDQLMASLAQNKTAKAKFHEMKYFRALETSVESTGELQYIAPDKLIKQTIKPQPELMQLDGDTLTLERGKRKFTMQVQDAPELAALIESMRGTLAGDRTALERTFTVALTGGRERWTLALTPINTKALQVIRNIEVSGSKGDIQVIEVLQANGDRSVTAVEKKP
ncbi:MAG: LolA family protein [Burkholderiaceae bacterium]